MASPSPARRPVGSACNLSKIERSLSAGMPVPLSRTVIRSGNSLTPETWPSIRTATVPCSVNFTALLTRLARIWRMRSGSPTICGGNFRRHFQRKLETELRAALG